MTLEEIQYKAQSIIHEGGDDDSAPYVEFVEELASMCVEQPSGDSTNAYRDWVMSLADGEILYCKEAFEAAVRWQKEQMMKDAVETTMVEGSLDNPTFVRRKIIIVKED